MSQALWASEIKKRKRTQMKKYEHAKKKNHIKQKTTSNEKDAVQLLNSLTGHCLRPQWLHLDLTAESRTLLVLGHDAPCRESSSSKWKRRMRQGHPHLGSHYQEPSLSTERIQLLLLGCSWCP